MSGSANTSWPGPFASDETFPGVALPYGGLGTTTGSAIGFATSNYVAISLVTPPVFGYYRLYGIPTSNQINVDPEPTPVGK